MLANQGVECSSAPAASDLNALLHSAVNKPVCLVSEPTTTKQETPMPPLFNVADLFNLSQLLNAQQMQAAALQAVQHKALQAATVAPSQERKRVRESAATNIDISRAIHAHFNGASFVHETFIPLSCPATSDSVIYRSLFPLFCSYSLLMTAEKPNDRKTIITKKRRKDEKKISSANQQRIVTVDGKCGHCRTAVPSPSTLHHLLFQTHVPLSRL